MKAKHDNLKYRFAREPVSKTENQKSTARDLAIFDFRFSIVLIAALGCAAIVGCAPRYMDRTPTMALHYSHVPIDEKELANLKALVAINPRDPQAAKARFWIGQDAFNRGRYAQAEKEYLAVLKHHPRSDWSAPAAIMSARSQAQQQRRMAALASLNKLIAAAPVPNEAAQAASEYAEQLIDHDLTQMELVQLRASYPGTVWDQQAAFVLAKRSLDAGNADAASKAFQEFLAAYPQSRYAAMARDLMDKAVRLVPFNRNRIGCMLPLSGPYAPYGAAIRQGLELALKTINQDRPEYDHLSLVVADTQGTSENALAALRRLAEAEKVMAVIGPVLSAEVKGLLPEVTRWRLPLISPSAGDPELTGISPYFFRYMLTNQQQGEAMAEYVVLRKNHLKVGILNGQDPYDRSLADAFEAKITQLGGEVVARVEYPTGQTDFKEQMLALGGVDPGKMKDLEIQERKSLERIMESASYNLSQIIAPEEKPAAGPANSNSKNPPKAVPDKRVVIVRLAEAGDQAQKDNLGKVATEKLSYALAVRPGVEVLTQDQTFKALKKLGLSSLGLDDAACRSLAEELQADYLVVGQVKQKVTEDEPTATAGDPLPFHYQIVIRLLRGRTAADVKTYTFDWTKSIATEGNVREMEAIYLPVPAGDAVLIASQLDFYDLKLALYGSDTWVTPKLLREGAEVLEGATVATGFWMDDPSSQTYDFVKAFETAFSAAPGILSVQAYDVMRLVGQVMKTLNMSQAQREDFLHKLKSLKQFTGVTGPALVGQDNEIRREPVFLELSQGQFKRVR